MPPVFMHSSCRGRSDHAKAASLLVAIPSRNLHAHLLENAANVTTADRDSLLRRVHELRSEHRDLDTVIARIGEGPGDQLQLQRLKKRKLRLKDELSWLESRLVPDIIA